MRWQLIALSVVLVGCASQPKKLKRVKPDCELPLPPPPPPPPAEQQEKQKVAPPPVDPAARGDERPPLPDEEYHGCGFPSTPEVPYPCGLPDGVTDPTLDVPLPTKVVGKPTALDRLSVRAPVLAGYSRKDWRHWVDDDRDCQDTRQEVLIAESKVPVTFKTARNCKVLTGHWTCPYTGVMFSDPSKLDVDHMVPLGNAHASGGHAWNSEQRRAFANSLADPTHLVAVSASANRSKGKKSPDQWMPDQDRCGYVTAWVHIKTTWQLSITPSEKRMLQAECAVATPPEPAPIAVPAYKPVRTVPAYKPSKAHRPKSCKKGKPCGNSCIAKSKTCRK